MSAFDLLHALAVAGRVDGLEAKMVALLHDAVEDGACTVEDLENAEMPPAVLTAVSHLTRGSESYESYIRRLHEANLELAVYVKLADLDANLARMDSQHASLTGRYRKAERILKGAA